MKTVSQVAELTGVSIRTLRYYDEIGLLKPAEVTEAGYRLYDDTAISKLREIMFFRELEFPLETIAKIMQGCPEGEQRPFGEGPRENPEEKSREHDRKQALLHQRELLEQKRNYISGLIEWIDDVIKGGGKMDFKGFTDEDVDRIVDHALALQTEETLKGIIQKFGDLESYRSFAREMLSDDKTQANLIHIYGSKDKAVEASLANTGDMGEVERFQKQIDEVYWNFAAAKGEDNESMALEQVKNMALLYKQMFRTDNARYLLLRVADDYVHQGQLVEATDRQYGEGVTEFIGKMIKKYYGVQ